MNEEREAGTFTSADIGRIVSVGSSSDDVRGVLYAVDHDTDRVEVTTYGSADPTYIAGPAWTELTITRWSCVVRVPSTHIVVVH